MTFNVSSLNFGALDDAPELLTSRQEWKKQRRGKFTASEFWKLMTNGKDKREMGQVAKSHISEKAVELLTDFDTDDSDYVSTAMQWGLDHESDAVQAIASLKGFKPYMTGQAQEFIESACGHYGCTPDGLIGDNSGLEIKCPNSSTHMIYMDVTDAESLKAIESKYYWQVQGSMLVTGRLNWWFASYDPRFTNDSLKLTTALIERNESDIDALKARLDVAIKQRDKLVNIALSQ